MHLTRGDTTQHCHRLAPQASPRRAAKRGAHPTRTLGLGRRSRQAPGGNAAGSFYPRLPPPPTSRTDKQLTAPADSPVRDPAHAGAFTTAVVIAIGGASSVHRQTGMQTARALPVDHNRPGSPPAAAPVLVRGFPRYPAGRPAGRGPVRLPSSVHRRRTSLDFPTRPAAPSAAGEAGISRLPRKVFPYVPGVYDRAGSRSASRYRRPGCGLPPPLKASPPTASAPQSNPFRGSIPGPHRTAVNASPPPSRATAHDSGPPWVANPSTYDSSIHNTLPVCAGAQEVKMILKEPHARAA